MHPAALKSNYYYVMLGSFVTVLDHLVFHNTANKDWSWSPSDADLNDYLMKTMTY